MKRAHNLQKALNDTISLMKKSLLNKTIMALVTTDQEIMYNTRNKGDFYERQSAISVAINKTTQLIEHDQQKLAEIQTQIQEKIEETKRIKQELATEKERVMKEKNQLEEHISKIKKHSLMEINEENKKILDQVNNINRANEFVLNITKVHN